MSHHTLNGHRFIQARTELLGVVRTRENNDRLTQHTEEICGSLRQLKEQTKAVCTVEIARMSDDQARHRLYELLTPLLDPKSAISTTTLVSEIVIRARTVLDILPQSTRDRLGAALFSPTLSVTLQEFVDAELQPTSVNMGSGSNPVTQLRERLQSFRSALDSASDTVGTSSMARDFAVLSTIATSMAEGLENLKLSWDRQSIVEFRDKQIEVTAIIDEAITRAQSLQERSTEQPSSTLERPQQLSPRASPRPEELRVRQVFDDVLDSLPSPVFRSPVIRTLLFSQVKEPIESLVKSEGAWSAREHFLTALSTALHSNPGVAYSLKEALANPAGEKDKFGTWSDSIEHLTALIGRLSYFGLCDAIEIGLGESRRRAALKEIPAFVQMHQRSKELAEWFGGPVPGREHRGSFFRQIRESEIHPIDALAKRVGGIDSIDALLATHGILPGKKVKKGQKRGKKTPPHRRAQTSTK